MKSNIFEIRNDYLMLIDEIEANEGELTPELEEALAINEEERDIKMEAYIHVIKQKESDNKLIDDEIDRLRKVKEVNSNSIKRLKNTIISAMEEFGLYGKSGNLSHSVGTYKIYTRNTQAVEINEVEYKDILDNKAQDVFNFKVARNLSYDELSFLFENLDLSIEDVRFTPNKTMFKSKIETDENLENIGRVVTNTSLTIR